MDHISHEITFDFLARTLVEPLDSTRCIAPIGTPRCSATVKHSMLQASTIFYRAFPTPPEHTLEQTIRLCLCKKHQEHEEFRNWVLRCVASLDGEEVDEFENPKSINSRRYREEPEVIAISSGDETSSKHKERISHPTTRRTPRSSATPTRQSRPLPSPSSSIPDEPQADSSLSSTGRGSKRPRKVSNSYSVPEHDDFSPSTGRNTFLDLSSCERPGLQTHDAMQQRSVSAPALSPAMPSKKRPKPPQRKAQTERFSSSRKRSRLNDSSPVRHTKADPREAVQNAILEDLSVPGEYQATDTESRSVHDSHTESDVSEDSEEESLLIDEEATPDKRSPPPEPSQKKTHNAREIDDGIAKVMKKKTMGLTTKTGIVYVLRDTDPRFSGLLKIGMTKQEMTSRKKQIQRQCNLELLGRFSSLSFRGFGKAEKLVQAELANFRVEDTPCSGLKCKKRHREWFRVSEDVARKVIDRWTDFMRQEPYDDDGILKNEWVAKLEKKPNQDEHEAPNAHEQRWERWAFIEPPNEWIRLRNALYGWYWHWQRSQGLFFWKLASVIGWCLLAYHVTAYWALCLALVFLALAPAQPRELSRHAY